MILKNIAIIGAGGLGKEVAVLIQQINAVNAGWNLIGFYDDCIEHPVIGIPVLGSTEKLNSVSKALAVVIAMGNPQQKQKIADSLHNNNLYFPALIHPSASLGVNVIVGDGTIITAGSRLTVDITIGKHVLLNLNSTIGHDVTIGDYTSIMPGAHLSGFVQIGLGVMVGTGASVLQKLKVGDYARVGAGALVTNNVNSGATVVGVPAREKI
ncbi:MAG TPA: acetyltransferase [Cyclobacteriaceae bacterium]|nr:acetyltransferase [Cyclobacteriaceae bacterium]